METDTWLDFQNLDRIYFWGVRVHGAEVIAAASPSGCAMLPDAEANKS